MKNKSHDYLNKCRKSFDKIQQTFIIKKLNKLKMRKMLPQYNEDHVQLILEICKGQGATYLDNQKSIQVIPWQLGVVIGTAADTKIHGIFKSIIKFSISAVLHLWIQPALIIQYSLFIEKTIQVYIESCNLNPCASKVQLYVKSLQLDHTQQKN